MKTTDGDVHRSGGTRLAGAAVVASALPGARPALASPEQPSRPSTPSTDAKPSTPSAPATATTPATTSSGGAPSNPPANIPPDPAYTFQVGGTYDTSSALPCWQLGTTAWLPVVDAQCVAAQIEATDAARASEELTPIRLPSDYSSLASTEQLFVLTDIERVSRGETPVVGLSPVLDEFAQAGAATGDDPELSFSAIPSSNWWGSNVVSGALDALDANYTWMYDDGYGGDNVDCTSPSSSGCWGHRDNELAPAEGSTLVMGAGDVQQRTGLQCLSELLVAVQDPADLPPLSYTWADAVEAGAAG